MTKEQLKKIAIYARRKDIDVFYPVLSRIMPKYNISGKLREAAFIAQVIHESGSFRYVREIASGDAYEGRKDIGNVLPGDGVRFNGRGLIQITGRANYKQMSNAFGIDFISHPELVETPEYAAWSACWWWDNKGLNRLADMGKFKEITKIINGGYNGLADREIWYKKAIEVL